MAITKGTVGSNRTSGGDPTVSVTVSTENCLIAVVTTQDSNTNNLGAASVIRNGQSFTYIGEFGGSGGTGQAVNIEMWYLLNPTTGTSNAVADCNSSINECTMTVFPLSGVDTADLINGTDGDTASGFAPAMSVTTDVNSCYLIGGLVSESVITGVGGGQDTDAALTDQSFENTTISSEAGGVAGANGLSFSMNNSAAYAQMMVAINPQTTTTVRVGSLFSMFR